MELEPSSLVRRTVRVSPLLLRLPEKTPATEGAREGEGDDLAFVAFGDEGVGRGGEGDWGGSEGECPATVAGDFGAIEVDGAAVIDLEVEAELGLEICGGGGAVRACVGGGEGVDPDAEAVEEEDGEVGLERFAGGSVVGGDGGAEADEVAVADAAGEVARAEGTGAERAAVGEDDGWGVFEVERG